MSDNKYVSLNRLADFLRKLNDKFAKSVHTHTITDIEDYKEPDLTGLALKSDIPSIEGLATEEYVSNAVANVGKNAETVNGISIQPMSQEEYDALAIKDPNTLYIIV